MADHASLEFSFSGLKTHAVLEAAKHELNEQTRYDLAYAFQDAAIDALVNKCERALQMTNYKDLIVAGGVGANELLRERISKLGDRSNVRVYYPSLEMCTDNGAMIAYAGCLRLMSGEHQGLSYEVHPRWSLESLQPIHKN